MLRSTATSVAITVGLISGLCVTAQATDFRINSDVFVSGREEPVSQNVTLFRAGIVYDYVAVPENVTIFDPRQGKFVLLDPIHRVKTEIPTKDVKAFNEELKVRVAAHNDPLLRFMADPHFKISTPKANQLIMSGPNLTYQITTERSKDAPALRQYLEFSNWYAQLNTLVNAGSPPPYTRIRINEMLAKKDAIPTSVELTVLPPGKGSSEVKLTSRHKMEWKLLADDNRRIDETHKQLAIFKNVSFEEFQRVGEPELPAKTAQKPAGNKQR